MKKYRYTFEFATTEEQAKAICDRVNKQYTYYMRKHHKAHYTQYKPKPDSEPEFVVWYYV